MRKKLIIVLMLILMLVPLSVASAKDKPLRFETTYNFVGHFGQIVEGRLLVWQGDVFVHGEEGPVGTAEWWMFFPGGVDTGNVNHWEDAIWKIYLDDGGYIQGKEWGSTTSIPGGERANWRANGIVEVATGGYGYLEGRPMHDGGKVIFPLGGLPYGTGKLHINN
jgi:hypothetical protein